MVQRKSPFPTGFLGVDLSYSGVWNPVLSDTEQAGVTVSHGTRSEGGTPDVSSLSFAVKNGDGRYSPRNPNSPLYGLIGRNTPARATLALGANWLNIKAASNSSAHTPDVAALDITGDIDIRWHGYQASWNLAGDLMSKYDTSGNQRSWILRCEADGTLTLFWSVTGSSTLREARSTVAIPAWAGEIALRVTLDVDNGAGGCTARFYYSNDLDGTWTQLGPDIVQATTTSIFNSTAQFRLGKAPTSSANWPAQRVYGWELRAGVGGAIRSSGRGVNLVQTGSTFTDAQGLVWTLANSEITNRHTIAVGEVAEWPVEWNRKGPSSVLTQVQASGATRRLGQGHQPIQSPIYRSITSSATDDLKAYWPMEEPEGSTAFGSFKSAPPGRWTGDPQLASSSAFGGSRPIPVLGTGELSFSVPSYVDTNVVQVRFLVHAPSSGWSANALCHVRFEKFGLHTVSLYTGGTVGTMRFLGRDQDGGTVFDTGYLDWDLEDKPARASIRLTQNGTATDWRVSLDFTTGAGLELTGSVASTSFGRCTAVLFNWLSGDMNVAVGHLTVQAASTSPNDIPTTVLNGYLGEGAQSRQARLAAEQSVTLIGRGHTSRAIPMGAQPAATFLDAVREAAAAEGGILHDDMASVALHRRALHAMGSQPPVVIPYTDNRVIPFTPVDDDGLTRNRITVSSAYATSATAEQATGSMSIAPPPLGVGLYDDELSLNLGADIEVQRRADWELHVGTWDEGRYPTMGVDLANPYFLANPELTRKLLALEPGDHLVVEDPPSWLPPRSVDVLVMGIQMVVTPLSVKLTWTCVPARPYHYGYFNHAEHRYSGEGTVTAGALTSAPTQALVLPGGSPGRASAPDASALDITGDLDVRAYVALTDWTPAATTTIAAKYLGTGSQRSWRFNVTTGGNLQLTTSATGVATQTNTSASTVPVADGEGIWVRATLDVDNGGGGRVYTYYTSTDGVTWTQLGAPAIIAGTTSIFSSTARLEVGASDDGTAQRLTGLVAALEVRNGIGGTVVANPDFSAQDTGATSFTDSVGNVWTVASPAAIGSVQLASSFTVTPPTGVLWTHDDGDYDILINGEVMTVKNVVGNVMTVDRSINGVVKAHPAGSAIALAEPSFYAR